MSEIADVVVIGGGPAGSTAAALLASAGRRVVVFEKERFPRFHIGESMLPFNVGLLRRLGLRDKVEASFLQKWGARIMSSDGAVARYICFQEGLLPGYPMAYQVLRSAFDEMLLANAAERGAEVHQGCAVVEASCSWRDGCEVTVRDAAGAVTRRRGRFLLDASGRDAFLASRRDLRTMSPHLRKAAVFAHYTGVPRAAGREAGDIILIVLRNGWFWMIPLAGPNTSVGLVTDASVLRGSGMPPERLLEEALRRCPAARERMSSATRVSPVWTASDYSYECREVAGDGYLLLGDAAAFIDPIFSTGVWLAMSSAEMAADALHRELGAPGRPGDLSPAAFTSYHRKVRHHVHTFLRVVRRFYGEGFIDLFLQPSYRLGIAGAVITLLAGAAEPPLGVRLRLEWVYFLSRLQRLWPLVPRVPLLGVLEAPQGAGNGAAPGDEPPEDVATAGGAQRPATRLEAS